MAALLKMICLLRVVYPVERVVVAEDLTYLLLLELLSSVISARLCLATVSGREDHIVDEFRYARTVGFCQNF